ncbi:MAG TPA: ThuA domain-containing protein [Lacipirellula sp.]
MELSKRLSTLLALAALTLTGLAGDATAQAPTAAQPPAKTTKVVFVTGDDEYASELSMPMMALILANHHGMTPFVLYAVNDKDERDPHGQSIPGLHLLRDADVAVFFMRWRALPEDQLDEIIKYAESGKPMIGIRTTSHAFKYDGPPGDKWNAEFAERWFGQSWIEHYGHNNSTLARVVDEQADHPILRGVDDEFWAHSWLYVQNKGDDKLANDVTVLMEGDAILGSEPGGEKFGNAEPLAWTREIKLDDGGTQRTFYTSLGHPRDFENEDVRKLLVNAIYWSLGREEDIPEDGAKVDVIGEYTPPDPK